MSLGTAFRAGFGLGGFEKGEGFGLGRGDGAVDALAEQFGVAVVGDQGGHKYAAGKSLP